MDSGRLSIHTIVVRIVCKMVRHILVYISVYWSGYTLPNWDYVWPHVRHVRRKTDQCGGRRDVTAASLLFRCWLNSVNSDQFSSSSFCGRLCHHTRLPHCNEPLSQTCVGALLYDECANVRKNEYGYTQHNRMVWGLWWIDCDETGDLVEL